MGRFRANLLANFAGTGWLALVQVACVPFLIQLLGIEAFGLIGFYVALQASLQILDLGVSPTINRELARYSALDDGTPRMRDLVRTFEVGYWTIGIVLGGAVAASAGLIADHWIKAQALSAEEIRRSVTMMAILIMLQWPLSFYQGGLRGLQRQVLLNAIKIIAATLSGVGGVLALWLIEPTVTVFFRWQIGVAALHVVLITACLWRSLPRAQRRPIVDLQLARASFDFAAGMSGIAFFAMILAQMDKVVLSKLLPLRAFGYYVLASTIVGGLQIIISPIFEATFPRLSALVARGERQPVELIYHEASQLMAVLILPAAGLLAFFSFDIVYVWTGQVETARAVAPIASLLAVGTAINGVMHLPYALQLAHGWTSLGLRITIAKVIVFLPLLLLVAARLGPVGAAGVWVLVNASYMVVALPLTHRRVLPGHAGAWLIRDVLLPLVAVLGVLLLARALVQEPTGRIATLSYLIAVGGLALAAGVCVADRVKSRMMKLLNFKLA